MKIVAHKSRHTSHVGHGRRSHRPVLAAFGSGTTTTAADGAVLERRAADVAVLGSSSVALAAAYSLARRGKKVVLIPDFGLTAPRPLAPHHVRPLHLVHPDPAVVSLSSEAAAYWRGLQAQAQGSGLEVLAACRSVDAGVVRRPLGAAGAGGREARVAELLGRMQEACKVSGVRLASLRPDELTALFPTLRLPAGAQGLLQPDGGTLHRGSADQLLTALCERQGVMLRERLVLRAWRDAGGHFVLRASGRGPLASSAVSVFEVEQLLLAPDQEQWPRAVLRMFGADAEVQTLQSSYARCTASEEAAGLPMWRWMGDPPPAAAAGGPIEPRGKGRTAEDQPPRGSSSSINTASSSSSSGVEVERQEQEQLLVVVSCPPPVPTRRQGAGGSSRGRGGGGGGGGADLGAGAGGKVHTVKLAVGELELGAGRAGDGKAGGVEGGGSSAAKLVSDPWAWQPGQPGRRSLESAHRLALQLVRGVGPILQAPAAAGPGGGGSTVAGAAALQAATPDGWPAVGFLPGVDQGRVVFALTSSGATSLAPPTPPPSSSSPRTPLPPAAHGQGGGGAAASTRGSAGSREGSVRQEDARGPEAGQVQGGGQEGSSSSSSGSDTMLVLEGRSLLADGYQLSPLLAKMAADLLCGASKVSEAEAERVDVARPALGLCVKTQGESGEVLDPWETLGEWQSGRALRPREDEEARERAEAVARGAFMSGRDLMSAEVQEAERGREARGRGAGGPVGLHGL